MSQRIVGGIFARGGSRGLPRKNVRMLGGKPLIAHAIETARSSSLIDRVFVSTDDEEIAAVARSFGAEVPFTRPASLCRDDSPEWLAWRHAIETFATLGQAIDVLVSVPATAPLRSSGDVDDCIRALLHSDADAAIVVTEANRNPFFNMVTLHDGNVRIAMTPDQPIHRRQDAPEMFDITTAAYALRASYVTSAPSLLSGRVKGVVIPRSRALDIDTEEDLAFAEFMLARASL